MAAEDLLPRPASRADLPAVLALYWRYDEVLRGARDTDEDDVSSDWDAADFDFTTSTLLLEKDGRVIGYAVVGDDGDADSVSDPDLREDGADDQLLAWLEAQNRPVEHHLPTADVAGEATFRRRGWRPTRRFWRMRIELDRATPDPVWPAGVAVRSHERPRDDAAVHALVETCFAEIGGQHPRTLEQWSAALLATPRFDPALCLVARCDGDVVGAALSQDLGDYGFVRQLAVAPAMRGKGLGSALIYECFRRHAACGLPATVLGVDAANPTGALALYEKAGMHVVEEFHRWEWTP